MAESQKNNDVFFLYRATGMSMFPYICDGEMLVVRKAVPDEINCGDIVLFSARGAGTKIAHFVGKKYAKDGEVFFQTRGSRSAALEEPVSFAQVAGKVMTLKRGTMVFDLDARGRRSLLYRLSCFWHRCMRK
jgi:signal peptidase I